MPQKDIIPPALQKGDTIAFLSPSNRLNTLFSTRLSRANSFFQTHGFRTLEIFTPIAPNSTYKDTLLHRAQELNSAFRNPDVKAIICTIGGLSANSILPFLDWEGIRSNPKVFVGYSDITILHHAIYVKTGLRTFYGPAAIPQFGEFPAPQKFTVEHFFGTVMKEGVEDGGEEEDEEGQGAEGKAIVVPRSVEWCPAWVDWLSEESETRARKTAPSPGWKWLRKGQKARGRLYGGCLPSIVQLTGTPYLPSGFYHGKILFLETPELGEPNAPFPVEFARCAMVDLRNAGILEGIVGLVLGRPFMYDEKMTMECEKMVVDVCYGLDFPILARVDVGHTDPILTLPLGVMAVLDSEENSFVLEESAVC